VRIISVILGSFSWALILNSVIAQDRGDGFNPSKIELLYMMRAISSDPFLQGNVGLLDEQIEKLQEICEDAAKEHRSKRMEIANEVQRKKAEENLVGEEYAIEYKRAAELLKDEEDGIASKALQEIDEIIVPSQRKMLRQYAFRSRHNVILSPFKLLRISVERIGMSNSKQKNAKKTIDGIEADYKKEVNKLRKKAIDDFLSSLDAGDADKLEDLIGRNIFPPIQ